MNPWDVGAEDYFSKDPTYLASQKPPYPAPEGKQWSQVDWGNGPQWQLQGMPSKDSFVDKLAGMIPFAGAALITGGAAGAFGGAAGGGAAESAALAGGGEVGSGYAASGSPWWLNGTGADAVTGGAGVDAFSGGGDAIDLGGGLQVDEFGNTTGGLFQGGAGTPGAGDFSGGGSMTWDDIVNYAKKAGANIPGGLISGLLRGVPAAAGAVGANQQSKAFEELANKYLNLGAPSRARYEASYAPGFTMANDPGYKDALDQTTKSFLHKASVTGNPAESPNAWNQTLKDVNSSFAYPALQNYRSTNAGTGGLATLASVAPGADTAAVNAGKGVYDAVGAGAADIFNPPKSMTDILRELRRANA